MKGLILVWMIFPVAALSRPQRAKSPLPTSTFRRRLIGKLSYWSDIALRFCSAARHIFFCASYVYPVLLHDVICLKVQLTFLTPTGDRIPVIANAKHLPNGLVVWSLFRAENRNKLFDELAET